MHIHARPCIRRIHLLFPTWIFCCRWNHKLSFQTRRDRRSMVFLSYRSMLNLLLLRLTLFRDEYRSIYLVVSVDRCFPSGLMGNLENSCFFYGKATLLNDLFFSVVLIWLHCADLPLWRCSRLNCEARLVVIILPNVDRSLWEVVRIFLCRIFVSTT